MPLQHGVLPSSIYANYRSYKKRCLKLRGKLLDVLVINNKKFSNTWEIFEEETQLSTGLEHAEDTY